MKLFKTWLQPLLGKISVMKVMVNILLKMLSILLPKAASTYLHHENISAVTTSSIGYKGLVSW